MRSEITGWLFAVYPHRQDGAILWLITPDGARLRLRYPFEATFYLAARQRDDLLRGYRYLSGGEFPVRLHFTSKRDLFKGEREVLEVRCPDPITLQHIAADLRRCFRGLQFYNARIPFPVRFGGRTGAFPMAKCRLLLAEGDRVTALEVLDSPWDLSYDLPDLRCLTIEPQGDPDYALPPRLSLRCGAQAWELETRPERELLLRFQAVLNTCDPDVILASRGDGWLFPHLQRIAARYGMDFNPNRDPARRPLLKDELTYHSYGQVHYRPPQTLLFGRWHIDPTNASMSGGFSLHAAIEMARVSGVDVQIAARNSPGAGFTAMQIRQALRWDVLVPEEKRQTEPFRPLMDLNSADGGGLNYHPVAGLHRHVAELDFFSMYPSIMAGWNISGETAGEVGETVRRVPRSQMPIRQDAPGLVASILKPLLEKRRLAKALRKTLRPDDPRLAQLQGTIDGLKWLGYVSFGYQGHAHNLFGRILAHEAICAIGREMLVRAIETAQEFGFDVLAANTDSIFVHKAGAAQPEDFRPLMDEINRRTGLVIELEGIFLWLAFLPSKTNPHIGASNRYFGRFADGSVKVRGMAQRRADTPPWIRRVEQALIAELAKEGDSDRLSDHLPAALGIVYQALADLYAGRLPLEDLVTCKRLAREPEAYKGLSEPAKAARQLRAAGVPVRVGQRVSMVYVRGERPGVYAWGLPQPPRWEQIDKARYRDLLIRSAHQVLQPFGLSETDLTSLALGGRLQRPLLSPPGEIRAR